jgi:hypothetical protein
MDSDGKLVRHFSSADPEKPLDPAKLDVPDWWPRPPMNLSTEAGMHRFVWDLHYPPPEAEHHDYPIAAIYRDTPREPLGPAVLPGDYQVKLTAGGQSSTQPLHVEMDPRVKTPPEGLARQLAVASGLAAALHDDSAALHEVAALRAALQALPAAARAGALGQAAASLDARAKALAEGGQGGRRGPGQGRGSRGEEPALAPLNDQLAGLLVAVDGSDAAPTTQQEAAAQQLERRLAGLLARWQELRSRDLPALDQELERAGLPPLRL